MITKKLHKSQSFIKQFLVLASFLLVFIPDAYCGNHSSSHKVNQTEIISKNVKSQINSTTIRFIKNLKYVEDFKRNSRFDFVVLTQYYNRSQNIRKEHFQEEFIVIKNLLGETSTNYLHSFHFSKLSEYHN